MRNIWLKVGRLMYWLAYPAQVLILPRTQRTRVLVLAGDKVLVVRPWMSDGRWQLPGGGMRRGETPAAGAQRELSEETGIQLGIERFTDPSRQQFHRGLKKFPYYLFQIHLDQAAAIFLRRPEIADCQWVPINELNPANAYKDVIDALGNIDRQ